MTGIKVAVVVGDPVEREGIVAILTRHEDLAVVAIYSSAESALEDLAEICPEVVLIGDDLPGIPGSLACPQVLQRSPDTVPIVLADLGAPGVADALAAAGAGDVLPRDSSSTEIAFAVRRAVHPAIACRVHVTHGGPFVHTRRLAVLRMVAKGHTDDHIARVLGVSPSTVKLDVRNLTRNLGARDRAGAVAVALRRGLVQ